MGWFWPIVTWLPAKVIIIIVSSLKNFSGIILSKYWRRHLRPISYLFTWLEEALVLLLDLDRDLDLASYLLMVFLRKIYIYLFKKQQVFHLNILLSCTGSFISIEIHRLLMPQRYFKYYYNLHKNWKLISNYYLLTKWLIWKISKEERHL